jgi:hypothetical protein
MPDDMSYYDRRLARKLEDPEFRAEFERQKRGIENTDRAARCTHADAMPYTRRGLFWCPDCALVLQRIDTAVDAGS